MPKQPKAPLRIRAVVMGDPPMDVRYAAYMHMLETYLHKRNLVLAPNTADTEAQKQPG